MNLVSSFSYESFHISVVCVESFNELNLTFGHGDSVLNDADSLHMCKELCSGDGLANDTQCYGFDYNVETRECEMYTSQNYDLVESNETRVVHYKKTSSMCSQSETDVEVANIGTVSFYWYYTM